MRYPASREARDHPARRAVHLAGAADAGQDRHSRARHSIAGTICIIAAALKPWKTNRPGPDRVWNRIPEEVRERIIGLALEEPDLSPRELAVRFTDTEKYFVSEASAYRLLKAHDLIASPAYIVIKAAEEFQDKTTAPNQLWQTDFTYLKVIGWGWLYLSTVLDDFSRYIIAWKLCTTMRSEDVTATLEMALEASGCDRAKVALRPRLLSDNGPSYIAGDLAKWLKDQGIGHVRGAPFHPRPRARSSAGIRRSRTGSCWRTTICPAISKPKSPPSSPTTTTCDTTRAIDNLTPADVYFGRGQTILLERERIKRQTITEPTLATPRQAA